MRKLTVVFILCASVHAHAQFDKLIKKGLDKGTKMAEGKLDAERDRLDSIDFNYAISVIDNSGMMDIKDFDEAAIKSAYTVSNTFLKSSSQKTTAQKCRDILDVAEKFYEVRQYTMAEVYFIDAKLNYESEGLTENINYSKVFADMGLLYATMGRFDASEKSTRAALEMREQTPGKGSRAYMASLNNLAVLDQERGRYNEAEKNFEAARELIGKQIGSGSQEYATVLNNQAILYAELGRNAEGIAKLTEASAIMDKLNKKSMKNQVGLQSNLALLYQRTGKFNEAEAIYLKLEKGLGNQNPYYAGVLNNLALLYVQMNKLDKVEDYLKRSAGVYKSRFGDQNPNYAKVLNDLGNFYRMQGKFPEAETNLVQALAIRSTALGTNHPDYVKSEEDLGILYWKKGEPEKAAANYSSAMSKSLDFINQYFPPMSEVEKTRYWEVLQPRFQRYYNYCLDAAASNPGITKTLFDYQLLVKGLLLNSTNKIKAAILASGNDELIKDYTAWLDKKETLARYYSLSKEDLTAQKIDLVALEKEANDMERSLSQRSTDFTKGYESENPDFNKVMASLQESDALVELIRIHKFDKDFTADVRYAALITTKGSTEPKMVVLDNGAELETRYAKFYKNAILQRLADPYSYDQFWGKIDPLLAGKKTIYLSPDGVYNQLNVNTFRKKDGDYLGNRLDVVVVGNTRDVLEIKSRKPAVRKTAFVLGFPDYAGAATPLPGTKTEIDAIGKILKTSGYTVTQKEQRMATESSIKELKGPNLIHIATHGYFLADSDIGEGMAMGVNSENARSNPLLRSGLILAGVPDLKKAEGSADLQSNDNGVLTAYEAMNLNLEGTDLIVLSACETGLGEVKAGEGVYGLQRAFQVAGANALIMSLWKVDDQATQMLMTGFYNNWTKTGNKLRAFKQAQLQLMTKYKDPYYWGAFVMMGN